MLNCTKSAIRLIFSVKNCCVIQDHLTNCAAIDTNLDELLRETAVVTELTQRCIHVRPA